MKYFALVIKGDGRGTKLGFPTINIKVSDFLKEGVFIVKVHIDNKLYYGLMHIGAIPTFDKLEFSTEIHLFKFNKIILEGAKVSFELIKKIRDIVKFDSIDLLVSQILKDIEIGKNYVNTLLNK
jgi:riboflavin kinase/FMN adenylyltransferase